MDEAPPNAFTIPSHVSQQDPQSFIYFVVILPVYKSLNFIDTQSSLGATTLLIILFGGP